jgi:hypothetical protein
MKLSYISDEVDSQYTQFEVLRWAMKTNPEE